LRASRLSRPRWRSLCRLHGVRPELIVADEPISSL